MTNSWSFEFWLELIHAVYEGSIFHGNINSAVAVIVNNAKKSDINAPQNKPF